MAANGYAEPPPGFDEELQAFVDREVQGTLADRTLQRDVLASLFVMEKRAQPSCTPQVTQIEMLKEQQDGSVTERWDVSSCQVSSSYEVDLVPTETGGAIFRIHPLTDSREPQRVR